MGIQEILQELEHLEEGKFPREALQEAIAQQEAITPALLDILQWSIGHLDEIYDDASYMEHTYAMYLLAQFREQRAYPLIVEFFSIPDEKVMEVCGDLVTEDLSRILASVSGDEMAPICSLIENSELDGFIRGAGIRALVTLALCDESSVSREEVMNYFQSLFREKLERTFSQVWNSLVGRSTDLYPEEVYDDIRQAYEDDLIESFYIGFEEVEEVMAEGKEATLNRSRNSRDSSLISDTIQEMEWWACFRKPEQQRKRDTSLNKLLKKAAKSAHLPKGGSGHTIRRTTPKVGRNDPCPCGSGKKYKKCCLNKG